MSMTDIPLLQDQLKMPVFKQSRSSTLEQNYDPAAYPPDLQFAAEHGQSRMVGQYIPPMKDVQRCRCCLQPIHKQPLPLQTDLSQLFHLGTSTPLYFQFVKQCLILLLFNFFLITIPNMIINFTQGHQCGLVQGGIKGIMNSICRGSIINVMNVKEVDAMQYEAGIMFAAVICNIVFIGFLELRMDLIHAKYQEGRLKAADYSLMIKGLPSDITINEIQKYVQDKMLYSGAPDLTINKIYIIYNFKNYLNVVQKRQTIAEKVIEYEFQIEKLQEKNLKTAQYEKKLKIQAKRDEKEQFLKNTQAEMQIVQSQIYQFEEAMSQIKKRIAVGGALQDQGTKNISNFSGKVIITVNNRRSQQKVIQKNTIYGCWQRLSYSISELISGDKTKVVITRAPQPQDIIFANMGSKPAVIWKTRMMYSLLIFFLLCLDFLIVALTKKFLKQQKAIAHGNIIFSFINSIIVSLFCSLFRRIIRASQDDSYYNTYSRLGYKMCVKLVLVFMINMLFTTFVANVVFFYLVKEEAATFETFPLNFEGFVFDCFFLISTNPCFTLFLVIFDHRHIRGMIKKYRISHHDIAVSQGEANRSFQNMNFDVTYKVGTIYRFLIFSGGIAILYPLSFFICGLALSLLYCLDKYLLLRRYSITLKMSGRFSLMTQKILAQFPIYVSLTTLLVMFIPVQDGSAFQEQKYTKVFYYLSGISVGISILNYMVGYRWLKSIFKSLLSIKDREEEEEFPEYKFIENDLENDYSHNYPYFRVTKVISRDGNEDIRTQKVKQLRNNQKIGTLDLIKHYMSTNRYES